MREWPSKSVSQVTTLLLSVKWSYGCGKPWEAWFSHAPWNPKGMGWGEGGSLGAN